MDKVETRFALDGGGYNEACHAAFGDFSSLVHNGLSRHQEHGEQGFARLSSVDKRPIRTTNHEAEIKKRLRRLEELHYPRDA